MKDIYTKEEVNRMLNACFDEFCQFTDGCDKCFYQNENDDKEECRKEYIDTTLQVLNMIPEVVSRTTATQPETGG